MPYIPTRAALLATLLVSTLVVQWTGRAQSLEPPPFDEWRATLMTEAAERGISDALIQAALAEVEPRARVIAEDRNQAEQTQTFAQYYRQRVSDALVRQGRRLGEEHTDLLSRVEGTYGVPRQFLLAIWGMESRFGANTGNVPIFQALVTLAWEPRRAQLFRRQLFDALTIVARGDIALSAMRGSWAGAMGQSQFLPSSYLEFAVDADGDGRRDIWHSEADTLGSIANYLRGWDWNAQETWGREVRVPDTGASVIATAVPARTGGCSAMRQMTMPVPLATGRASGSDPIQEAHCRRRWARPRWSRLMTAPFSCPRTTKRCCDTTVRITMRSAWRCSPSNSSSRE